LRNEAISIKGIVQISPKYRGSFNILGFEEIKPHSDSLRDGRLDLVYYQTQASTWEIRFGFGFSIDRGYGSLMGLPMWPRGVVAHVLVSEKLTSLPMAFRVGLRNSGLIYSQEYCLLGSERLRLAQRA